MDSEGNDSKSGVKRAFQKLNFSDTKVKSGGELSILRIRFTKKLDKNDRI